MLATKDGWIENRNNLQNHQQVPVKRQHIFIADNDIITKPRHAG